MTTLEFKDRLTENAFSFGNDFVYPDDNLAQFGLCFSRESPNYPFIMKGGLSDTIELEYSVYSHQLRGRMLTTKKIKEVMDSSKLPLLFNIKRKYYLIGKGFLSTYDPTGGINKILFIACVDGTKNISSIAQVRFFVSKDIYNDEYKAIQPAIKDIMGAHPGDVTMCNDVLDYIGERLTFPRGGSLSEMNNYKQAVVRTALAEAYFAADAPFIVESNRGTVAIESGPIELSEAAERAIIMDMIGEMRTTGWLRSEEPAAVVGAAVPPISPEMVDLVRGADASLPF